MRRRDGCARRLDGKVGIIGAAAHPRATTRANDKRPSLITGAGGFPAGASSSIPSGSGIGPGAPQAVDARGRRELFGVDGLALLAKNIVGDIYEAQGGLDDALAASRESMRIMQKLTEQDATNAGWQRGLAVA